MVLQMWQVWLAAPLVPTVLGAGVVWWRCRPPKLATVHVRVAEHHAFLDALAEHTGTPEQPLAAVSHSSAPPPHIRTD